MYVLKDNQIKILLWSQASIKKINIISHLFVLLYQEGAQNTSITALILIPDHLTVFFQCHSLKNKEKITKLTWSSFMFYKICIKIKYLFLDFANRSFDFFPSGHHVSEVPYLETLKILLIWRMHKGSLRLLWSSFKKIVAHLETFL